MARVLAEGGRRRIRGAGPMSRKRKSAIRIQPDRPARKLGKLEQELMAMAASS